MTDFPSDNKTKVKGEGVVIVYNMETYKLKAIPVEDVLNYPPIRNIDNNYHREDRNCDVDSSMVLPDGRKLCDTAIYDNKYKSVTQYSFNKIFGHISILLVQNIGSTQAKQTLPRI